MLKGISRFQSSLVLMTAVSIILMGCSTAYYGTMEKLGYHKRDIMVSRVESARDAQEEAKEQFKSALEQFNSVLKVDGGELEEKYNQLKAAYDRSEARAEAVHDRIENVEDVSAALFDEWQAELDQYTSDSLRRSSARKLRKTKQQYAKLIGAMKRAEKKMEPVLRAFNDQVLFLKHNLNARAIASLQTELASVESEVNSLIRDMEASIKEADAFINAMAKE